MDFTFQVLRNTREIFKKIIEQNALEDLNKIPNGFNNTSFGILGMLLFPSSYWPINCLG